MWNTDPGSWSYVTYYRTTVVSINSYDTSVISSHTRLCICVRVHPCMCDLGKNTQHNLLMAELRSNSRCCWIDRFEPGPAVPRSHRKSTQSVCAFALGLASEMPSHGWQRVCKSFNVANIMGSCNRLPSDDPLASLSPIP